MLFSLFGDAMLLLLDEQERKKTMGSSGPGFLLLSRLFVNLNARNENYEARQCIYMLIK